MVRVERRELVDVVDQLLAGKVSREDAAKWALDRACADGADRVALEALDVLCVCDEPEPNALWNAILLDQPLDDDPYPYFVDLAELAELRDRLAG